MFRSSLSLMTLLCASPAFADAPAVVTDIKPVYLITQEVMAGVGNPHLLIDGAANPHDHALKPSDAQVLTDADLVIWIGEGLTPWLEKGLESLAPDTRQIELMGVEGAFLKPFDVDGEAGHDDHGHEEEHADGHDDHGHDDHGHEEEHADGHDDHDHDHDKEHAEAHDAHAEEEEHAEGHDHGHGHAHSGEFDPHAWLDPANAVIWATAIAENLAELDPTNAALYRENAKALGEEIKAKDAEIAGRLDGQTGTLLFLHDAFGYLTDHYGLNTLGAVSDSDAAAPTPARLRDLRTRIVEEGVGCAFAEPQFDAGPLEVALEGTDVQIGRIDPLGTTYEVDGYPAFLDALAEAIETCQKAPS